MHSGVPTQAVVYEGKVQSNLGRQREEVAKPFEDFALRRLTLTKESSLDQAIIQMDNHLNHGL